MLKKIRDRSSLLSISAALGAAGPLSRIAPPLTARQRPPARPTTLPASSFRSRPGRYSSTLLLCHDPSRRGVVGIRWKCRRVGRVPSLLEITPGDPPPGGACATREPKPLHRPATEQTQRQVPSLKQTRKLCALCISALRKCPRRSATQMDRTPVLRYNGAIILDQKGERP